MNWRKSAAALVLSAGLLAPIAARADDMAKEYQVTGIVTEVHDGYVLVVNKDKENFEITVDKETKVDGKLTKGEKVTIHYRMTAKSVEDKSADKKMPAMDKK